MPRGTCSQHPHTSWRARRSTSERAHTTVEFIGTLPLLALGATCCLQALLVALSVVFAQGAADRAARDEPSARVVASIPAGWRARSSVSRTASGVQVQIRPPALLPGTGRWFVVRASSEVVQ